MQLVLADPLDACAPLNSRLYRGKVVLVSDSTLNCNFTEKSVGAVDTACILCQ
jgi:hypothetical protein